MKNLYLKESSEVKEIFMNKIKESIEKGRNIFILDFSHEYEKELTELLNKNGYKIHSFEDNGDDNSKKFNPFRKCIQAENGHTLFYKKMGLLDEKIDSKKSKVKAYLEGIFLSEESDDPFWQNAALDLVYGILLSKILDNKEVDLNEISGLLDLSIKSEEEFNSLITNEEVSSLLDKYIKAPEKTKEAIYSVARQKYNVVMHNYFNCFITEYFVQKSELDTYDMDNSKVCIFANYSSVDNKMNDNIIDELLLYVCERGIKMDMYIEYLDTLHLKVDSIKLLNKSVTINADMSLLYNSKFDENDFKEFAENIEIIK